MNLYQKHTRDNLSNFQFAFSQNVSKLSNKVLAVNPRYILFFSFFGWGGGGGITFSISVYIMCVCLFSALSRRVGALQISIIIIKNHLHCSI